MRTSGLCPKAVACAALIRSRAAAPSFKPDELPGKHRARLAGFGVMAAQAETPVGKLSGGQKARLSLLIATLEAPHMLILDEPTNHLDMESREALVEALTAYTGAVVLVSHDMHLLAHVADRLWLVDGGTVKPFEDDLEAYRRLLLASPEKPSKEKPKPEKRVSQADIQALKSELKKAEARVAKLEEMREKLARKLADPALYEDARKGELATWNAKYAEVMERLERAETIWMTVGEKLESAQAPA